MLSKVQGLLEYLDGFRTKEWQFYSAIAEDKGYLGSIFPPAEANGSEKLYPMCIRRHIMQERLIEFAEKQGIPVKWGYQLESLEQDDEQVTVKFANGVQESFSFVIGCDGLHSDTRKSLFGEQRANYTGLSMVRSPFQDPEIVSDLSVCSGPVSPRCPSSIVASVSEVRSKRRVTRSSSHRLPRMS